MQNFTRLLLALAACAIAYVGCSKCGSALGPTPTVTGSDAVALPNATTLADAVTPSADSTGTGGK